MFKKILNLISVKEWLVVLLLAIFIFVLTTAPIVYGYYQTKPDQVYTGVKYVSPNDWFVYYAYLLQVKQGNYLLDNLHTSEPQSKTLNIFWLGAGLLGRVLDLDVIITFHLVRLILFIPFFFLAYLLIATVFETIRSRLTALFLLAFASGNGMLVYLGLLATADSYNDVRPLWPLDLWVPEFNTFFTLGYSPHFIASLILITLTFLVTIFFLKEPKWRYAIIAGLSALICFSFHPFHVLTIYSVLLFGLGLIGYFYRERIASLIKFYLIVSGLSLPAVIYYFWLITSDPFMKVKALQNICLTPPVIITIISGGFLLILSVLAIYFYWHKKIKRPDPVFIFLAVWLLVQFCLLYFPVNFQRRMSEGLHWPLVLLATYGIKEFYLWAKAKKSFLARYFWDTRLVFIMLLVGLLSFSNVFVLYADFLVNQGSGDYFSFFVKSDHQAMVWFNGRPGTVTLTSPLSGMRFPAYSGTKAYLSHGIETVDYLSKQVFADWFYSENRDQTTELEALKKRGITHIFYGPTEKDLGSFNPLEKNYLKPVYGSEQSAVYEIIYD